MKRIDEDYTFEELLCWASLGATIAFALLLMAACSGCAVDRPGPVISIVYEQDGVPDLVKSYTTAGASAWRGLEIGYAETPTLPECSLAWWDGQQQLPCSITIHVLYVAGSTLGHAGLTDSVHRRTQIAYELSGSDLAMVVAHEVGHSVFNSGDHGDMGLMANPPQSVMPTDADRDYAIAHTNGWVQP